jgi:hypothetical protein
MQLKYLIEKEVWDKVKEKVKKSGKIQNENGASLQEKSVEKEKSRYR